MDIQNVSFRYEADKPLIENFNLHTEPGRRIAIVGPTGCGKTTFINLLMRFYDVTGGSISVDGNPITEFPDMPSAEAMAWFSRIPGSNMELSATTSVSESRMLLMRK